MQKQLQALEELILSSPRLPLTQRTIVNEEALLDQLDQVRMSLPEALQQAERIVQTKDDILTQAQSYAQDTIKTAERRAAQILDETRIVQRAELEAQQIRQQTEAECQNLRQTTLAELERLRRQTQQELAELRRVTVAECQQIRAGADTYAERVLVDMDRQLTEMLRVVRNGRQHLKETSTEQLPL